MTIEAVETDLTVDDVPGCELWDIKEFERYKVKLVNNGGMGEIVDFGSLRRGKLKCELTICESRLRFNKNSAFGLIMNVKGTGIHIKDYYMFTCRSNKQA